MRQPAPSDQEPPEWHHARRQSLISRTVVLLRLERSAGVARLARPVVGLLVAAFVAVAGAAVLVSAMALGLIALEVPAGGLKR